MLQVKESYGKSDGNYNKIPTIISMPFDFMQNWTVWNSYKIRIIGLLYPTVK